MNFKGNFKQLGKLDISGLKNRILLFTEEDWQRNDSRQKKFAAHKDTTTIPLIYNKDNLLDNPKYLPDYQTLKPLLAPIYELIARNYNTSLKHKRLQKKHGRAYPVRTIIARLKPGGVISAHMDRNHLLSHSHRIHVPIVTDENVHFGVGRETKYLREGEIWEINNRREHQVENRGGIYRIHIIIDWTIPGERCCCGVKANPQGVCSPDACHDTDFRSAPCDCLN